MPGWVSWRSGDRSLWFLEIWKIVDFCEGKIVFEIYNFSLFLVLEDLQNSDELIAFMDRVVLC